jgi:hypothetical protein
LFLDDGRVELDNNTVERERCDPSPWVGRTVCSPAPDGGARHWAIVASLVATTRLNGEEPLAWLTDVLERVVPGRTEVHELEGLLPWSWQAGRLSAAVRA